MLERKEREGVHKGPRPIIQPFEIHVAAKTWITLKNLSIKKFASPFFKKIMTANTNRGQGLLLFDLSWAFVVLPTYRRAR